MRSSHLFTPQEQSVLKALQAQAFKPGIASAHAIRLALIEQGHNKRETVEAMARLVDLKVLERVRVIDDNGLFYMAYRLCHQEG